VNSSKLNKWLDRQRTMASVMAMMASMGNRSMPMSNNSMCYGSHMHGSSCVGGSTDFTRNLLLDRVAHFSGNWMAHFMWDCVANLPSHWHLDGGASSTGHGNAHLSGDMAGSLNWDLVTLPLSGGLADGS
jgi:hypothetical protein